MRKSILSYVLLLSCVASVHAITPDVQGEINHLLRFVEHTDCHYIRNGEVHTGTEAAAHIGKKYDYFKDDVDTAEKFIELSATRSTLSGDYYTVRCEGEPEMRSQQWLLQELARYRKNGTE